MTTRRRGHGIRGEMVRTLQTIQIGSVLALQSKQRRDDELDMHEIDLQYQLPISGEATSVIAWGEITIEFEWEFHYAPANRDSRLVYPQMVYGAYVPGAPVGILSCVTDWLIDEDTNAIVGAVVAVGAIGSIAANPETGEFVEGSGETFEGHLHINFQGWAMSRDDFSDSPDLETGDDTS